MKVHTCELSLSIRVGLVGFGCQSPTSIRLGEVRTAAFASDAHACHSRCQIGVPSCEGFSHECLQIRLQYSKDDGRSFGFSSVITPLLNVISEENEQR
jgi:hypothetical protein